MHIYGYLQLAALVILLGTATSKAIAMHVRLGVNSFLPGRRSRLATVAFVITGLWAVEVVLNVLPTTSGLLPAPLSRNVTGGPWATLLGTVLVVVATALNLAAHRHLGNSWRLGIDERAPGDLVTRGVYARTRNPIYIAFVLLFAGTFLLNGTASFLVYLAVAVPVLHRLALLEERFLAERFGERFVQYRQRVPRYISLVRRDPAS